MTKRTLVVATVAVMVLLFGTGAYIYDRGLLNTQSPPAISMPEHFIRSHSPVVGPPKAPVTIIEFFDPSCESCRAFHPFVKEILAQHPNDVRLVLRYAPFHRGSDEAVGILEAARLQNLFLPVLESLLDAQDAWAVHGAPKLEVAWEAARKAGLDVVKGRKDAARPEVAAVMKQDLEDIRTAEVRQTPTFFVNGRPLLSFGPRQLAELVRSEVVAAKASAK